MSNPYTDLAAQLHAIANNIAELAKVEDLPRVDVTLYIQPNDPFSQEERRRAVVEMVSAALLGAEAVTRQLPSESWHHAADGNRGDVDVHIFCGVSDPAERDTEAGDGDG